jgi:hypothetical protein
MMEFWNNGFNGMESVLIPIFHHSTIPLFQFDFIWLQNFRDVQLAFWAKSALAGPDLACVA